MLQLKFAIYHRVASLSSQASSVHVCSIGWRIIDQTRLSSNTPCTPTVFLIQQSCMIFTTKWFVHMRTHEEKKWCHKGSHSSSVSSSNHLMGLQPCKKEMGCCTVLSGKCYCFVQKPLWKTHTNLKKKKEILAIWQFTGSVLSRHFLRRYNNPLFIFECFHDEQHTQWH